MRVRLLLAVPFVIGLAILPANVQAATQVYLMKGGFGGVFSTGLDDLAQQLEQRGIRASVASYGAYDSLATQAIALEKRGGGPIVIIGHSWGADNAFAMARLMAAAGARVALIVAFGPTHDLTAPANVARVINYYQGGTRVLRGRGFRGTIANVDLDSVPGIDHFNVEKSRRLHARVIAEIRALSERKRPRRPIRHRHKPHGRRSIH